MVDIPLMEAHELEPDVFPDHFVHSLETFNWVTAEPRDVAALYFYHQLDELIEVARAISFDFFKRPHLYRHIEEAETVSALARLHARYGHDEKLLSSDQRFKIYDGLFSTGEHQFTGGRDALLRAAAKFSERVYDTGEEMLRAAVRDAARKFKEYLTTLPGASTSWSRRTVLPELTDKTAYRILRDRGIRAAFGQSDAVSDGWPYQVDGRGDVLVEIASELRAPDVDRLNRDHVGKLQRVALRGAEAIATVIEYNDQADRNIVNLLILKSYTWYAALVELGGSSFGMDGGNSNRGLMPTSSIPSL
jgi:hypothetical protein